MVFHGLIYAQVSSLFCCYSLLHTNPLSQVRDVLAQEWAEVSLTFMWPPLPEIPFTLPSGSSGTFHLSSSHNSRVFSAVKPKCSHVSATAAPWAQSLKLSSYGTVITVTVCMALYQLKVQNYGVQSLCYIPLFIPVLTTVNKNNRCSVNIAK